MIRLADNLRDVLTGVADDEQALSTLRTAARAAIPAAVNIWSHYGGDAGGW